MAIKKPIKFHVRDFVCWDYATFPRLVGGMIEKYGRGPFRVVGVKLHTEEAMKTSPESHPEAVTIEINVDGGLDRHEFTGDWFRKIKAPRISNKRGLPFGFPP